MRLQLTHRGDYAVRAMVALARRPGEWLSSASIAAATRIPARFVTQVMGDLVRAGLVSARLGRAGGYRLARPASRISMLAIVEAIEGDARPQDCILRGGACSRDGVCDVHEVFMGARQALVDRLAAASLASTIAR